MGGGRFFYSWVMRYGMRELRTPGTLVLKSQDRFLNVLKKLFFGHALRETLYVGDRI
jgi:hypothetical protein